MLLQSVPKQFSNGAGVSLFPKKGAKGMEEFSRSTNQRNCRQLFPIDTIKTGTVLRALDQRANLIQVCEVTQLGMLRPSVCCGVVIWLVRSMKLVLEFLLTGGCLVSIANSLVPVALIGT